MASICSDHTMTLCRALNAKKQFPVVPIYVLSDITAGHPESVAKTCTFEKVHSHCIKCGISNSFICAWCVWKYKRM